MSSTRNTTSESKKASKERLWRLIRQAASKVVLEEDVWQKYEIHKLPAERVVRHMYHPSTQQWSQEETIVKMQPSPFTHGAMRYCFRLKKMATPPNNASNHRFHSFGWSRASNYVAKCYFTADNEIDTSTEAKQAIQNDILLQYEAAQWASRFNQHSASASKHINFIRAYVIEFVERQHSPMFAVERYISGTDSYGCGFTKHNTNSGYVDSQLHRKTPQVFSAHSFYSSKGERLVADIQGVGDMYTDPQVLSMDYRFGDGDLGPRGMALFFHSFRHCDFSDSMGIPIFPLSRNELKHQAKYDDDEVTISDDEASIYSELADRMHLDNFARLDLNRQRRLSSLMMPPKELLEGANNVPTERRSNMSVLMLQQQSREDVSKSIRMSLRDSVRSSGTSSSKKKPNMHRSRSDVDEVSSCLLLATTDATFDHRSFHRLASGEMRARHYHNNDSAEDESNTSDNNEQQRAQRRGTVVRKSKVAPPMIPDEQTKRNLGTVHYHLACLHGMGRFPHIVPDDHDDDDETDSPPYDVFSVLFHLCHAASLHNVSACLSLARVKSGLETVVADLLRTIVPVDFEGAKDLLRRAMHFEEPPSLPKAAAGCLLFQILHDEGAASKETKMHVLEDTLKLFGQADEEEAHSTKHKERVLKGAGFHVGDKVEANYCLEGTYYPCCIEAISDDGALITVRYDDDDSTESLTANHVRHTAAMTASLAVASSNSEGPLSDGEALGFENHDEKPIFQIYVLKAELGFLKEATGDAEEAARLFAEAAEEAMNEGKMKTATEWSLKASELSSSSLSSVGLAGF